MGNYGLPLAVLGLIFAASALVIGRGDGFRCLILLLGVPLFLLLMGGLLTHTSVPTFPLVLVTGATILAFQVILLMGWGRLGLSALVGAFGGLFVASIVGVIAVQKLRITGVFNPMLNDLWYLERGQHIDYRWLAFGSIVLAGAGIIADLAVGVAAALKEIHNANPAISRRNLFRSGIRFGSDVLSTEINSLPLAVIGATFGSGMLLLARPEIGSWPYNWMLFANDRTTAIRMVTLAAGTIALVLTIPMTAGIVAWVLGGRENSPSKSASAGAWKRSVLPRALLIVLAILAAGICVWLRSSTYSYPKKRGISLVRGTVKSATPKLNPWLFKPKRGEQLQELTVATRGGDKHISNPVSGSPVTDRIPLPGDRVIVRLHENIPSADGFYSRPERDVLLVLLFFLACGTVVVVGRWQGWQAVGALAGSIVIVILLLVAMARWRLPPIATMGCGAILMIGMVYLLICGWQPKALAAALGTLCGLIIGAAAAAGFLAWLGLSGQYGEYLLQLDQYSAGGAFDFQQLLVAAVLIGVLGVVMDISIGVASAVTEVHRGNPDADVGTLFDSGLAVGRKIMITMFGTIVFAYFGLNIAMFVLPWLGSDTTSQLLTNERIITEMFRVLIGGLAIVWTVPATAFLSAFLTTRSTSAANNRENNIGHE